MKKFEDYVDGEWVYYQNNYHDSDFQFRAYKSQYTHNAFRLKNNKREVVADISEITPMLKYEEERAYIPTIDSDADASGIYHIQD